MRNTTPLDRLGVLDGLRGIAILLVVWYHLSLVSGYTLPLGVFEMFARNGYLGVDLFFFVSGFCIAYPYARARFEGRQAPTLREFARRRALKIVPSYVLALLVFAVVYRTRFDSFPVEAAHFVAHLAFVHVWFHETFGSFSGPLWTLGVEVQFYVLFAFVAPQVVRRPLLVYGAFVAVAAGYRLALGLLGLDTDFGWLNQLPAVLDVFGAGILASFAFVAVRNRETAPSAALSTASAGAAMLVIVAGFALVDAVARGGGDDGVHRWVYDWRIAFGPVLFIATLGIALGLPGLRSVCTSRLLAWLSLVSYNAYLWNLEIAVGLQNAGLPSWAIFWLGAAGTIGIAALTTYFIERPLQRAGFSATFGRIVRTFAAVPARS